MYMWSYTASLQNLKPAPICAIPPSQHLRGTLIEEYNPQFGLVKLELGEYSTSNSS